MRIEFTNGIWGVGKMRGACAIIFDMMIDWFDWSEWLIDSIDWFDCDCDWFIAIDWFD